jgi:single-strand DNA-binding protein
MIRVPNLNLVILAGRLTAKPEEKATQSGTAVTNFTVAVNQPYKDGDGEWKSKTLFADVTAWGRLAEYVVNLEKGSPVLIQGSLQSNIYGKKKSLKVIAQKINSLEKSDDGDYEEKVEEPETQDDKSEEETAEIESEEDSLPF